jgi:nitroimidazol reductase NimA-like FMN-containing flavoprotein (pyridoxamine 5'-phosphate oxidase superfamily)
MSEISGLRTLARTIIEANQYMTLATADPSGLPWASPVWYAAASDLHEFFWISSPVSRHSSNIATRPQIAVVIFDSQQPIGTGQAVYLSAVAEQVADQDIDRGMATFSEASQARGGRAWSRSADEAPARHRLYPATAAQHIVLSSSDERIPVDPG